MRSLERRRRSSRALFSVGAVAGLCLGAFTGLAITTIALRNRSTIGVGLGAFLGGTGWTYSAVVLGGVLGTGEGLVLAVGAGTVAGGGLTRLWVYGTPFCLRSARRVAA